MADLFMYTPYLPSGLSISVYPLLVCRRRIPCPYVVSFPGGGGGVNTLLQVARYLVAGVLTRVGYRD